eukprot:scaffold85157_cov69-Phaeocystis_antarctica.AAC.5
MRAQLCSGAQRRAVRKRQGASSHRWSRRWSHRWPAVPLPGATSFDHAAVLRHHLAALPHAGTHGALDGVAHGEPERAVLHVDAVLLRRPDGAVLLELGVGAEALVEGLGDARLVELGPDEDDLLPPVAVLALKGLALLLEGVVVRQAGAHDRLGQRVPPHAVGVEAEVAPRVRPRGADAVLRVEPRRALAPQHPGEGRVLGVLGGAH